MTTIDTLIERVSGRVELTVRTVEDADPDLSWLGEYSDYREPKTENQKLYHRGSGLVLDHHGIWRNRHGWIEAAPEGERYGRDYGYIWCDNGHVELKYAIQDAKRLEDYGYNWYCVGIVATVRLAGAEIGYAACFGFESDSGEEYLMEEARNIAHEALAEAKTWRMKTALTKAGVKFSTFARYGLGSRGVP